MSKFQYAPGLPGYGTRGVDGSAGLTGLATYFSAYDGTSDSITIRNKIISNKILFPTDELLPDYPSRVYQTGDVFIDKNGRVFEIDLTLFEKYSNTGQQLNTSGFFESGPFTTAAPIYERYSNAYTISKFLIDVVYADTPPGNYAANPSETETIYGIGAVNYGKIEYVNKPVGTYNYHPFTVWTNATNVTQPERSIALVKEHNVDAWHLGNRDQFNTLRTGVDFYLDFSNVYTTQFVGDISTNSLFLPGTLTVIGDTSLNDLHVNNVANFYDDIDVEGDIIGQSALDIAGNGTIDGDLTVGTSGSDADNYLTVLNGESLYRAYVRAYRNGTLFVGTDANNGGGLFYRSNSSMMTGDQYQSVNFYRNVGGSEEVVFYYAYDDNEVTFRGKNTVLGDSSVGGNTKLGGNLQTYGLSYFYNTAQINGDLDLNGNEYISGNIIFDNTASHTIGITNSGLTRNLTIYAADMNSGNVAGTMTLRSGVASGNGGKGGLLDIYSGAGGSFEAAGSLSDIGGYGGAVSIHSGDGGDGDSYESGVAYANGAEAGDVSIYSGDGGDVVLDAVDASYNKWSPGRGGDIYIQTGDGGYGAIGARAGDLWLLGGTGGDTPVGYSGGNIAGDGGDINIIAGKGGVCNIGGDGGDGGNCKMYAGNGDYGPVGSGSGGHVYIAGGVKYGTAQDGNVYLGRNDGGAHGEVWVYTSSFYGNLAFDTTDHYVSWDQITKRITSVVAYISSDGRYKENLKKIERPLEIIESFTGYTFNYTDRAINNLNIVRKKDTGIESGLIAQDVEKLYPYVVKEIKAIDSSTQEEESVKVVQYEKIVPLLVEGIKEQQKEISELKDMVAQQQKQIETLLKKI